MLANYQKYKGRIHRFCIIYPEEVKTVEDAVKILEREKQDGAIGFGEHYGVGLMFDDPKNLLFYEACTQVELPVDVHIDQKRNMDEQGFAAFGECAQDLSQMHTNRPCVLVASLARRDLRATAAEIPESVCRLVPRCSCRFEQAR